MEISFSLETIDDAAAFFIESISHRKTIALHGEMGAGKTTFITRVVTLLGSQSELSSPTFSIINEYALADKEKVFHMDLYRLKNEAEAIDAGVEDCLFSGFLCLVEWPEIAPGLFPADTIHCYLTRVSESGRKLRINL